MKKIEYFMTVIIKKDLKNIAKKIIYHTNIKNSMKII